MRLNALSNTYLYVFIFNIGIYYSLGIYSWVWCKELDKFHVLKCHLFENNSVTNLSIIYIIYYIFIILDLNFLSIGVSLHLCVNAKML